MEAWYNLNGSLISIEVWFDFRGLQSFIVPTDRTGTSIQKNRNSSLNRLETAWLVWYSFSKNVLSKRVRFFRGTCRKNSLSIAFVPVKKPFLTNHVCHYWHNSCAYIHMNQGSAINISKSWIFKYTMDCATGKNVVIGESSNCHVLFYFIITATPATLSRSEEHTGGPQSH